MNNRPYIKLHLCYDIAFMCDKQLYFITEKSFRDLLRYNVGKLSKLGSMTRLDVNVYFV